MQEAGSSQVEVLRFYRPEDISQEQAYKADYWDVYASSERVLIEADCIVSSCCVTLSESSGNHTCTMKSIRYCPRCVLLQEVCFVRQSDFCLG